MTSSQESRNPSSSELQVTVVSVVVRSFPRRKTNKLKSANQGSRQASKIKARSNSLGVAKAGNLKLDFMAKSIGIHFFGFEYIFRCYRDNEI